MIIYYIKNIKISLIKNLFICIYIIYNIYMDVDLYIYIYIYVCVLYVDINEIYFLS